MFSFLESDRRRVVDAMRDVGATSPATARKVSELPDVVRERLESFVTLGVIREGAPGTFYLFVPSSPSAWTAHRVRVAVLFWLLVISVPVLLLWLSSLGT